MTGSGQMAITEVDEKLLVQAYQAGDERAFDTIVRTQWKALYAHAIRRLDDHDAAEDAVQDTLLRAYRALPKLTGDLALRAWLHRILTNVCHDEGNRRRRTAGLVEKVGALPEETAADPLDEAVLHDTVRIMSEALEDLPDSYREALVLRYVDGLSFREVAEAAGITEENARARVHRGRLALHQVLSRIAVVLAFVIPGLRRADQGAATTPVAAPDGVNVVTQLTSHAVTAAPTVSRFAEVAMATSGGKSAFVTTAVAAVAAIAVPVTAYTVHETAKPVERPAAVAAPAEETTRTTLTPTAAGAGVQPASASAAVVATDAATTSSTAVPPTTSTSTSSTTTTAPPSAARPFESPQPDPAPTTSAPPPPPPAAPPAEEPAEEPGATTATLTGTELVVTGDGPNADVSGPVRIADHDAVLGGRLTIHDDGAMSAELTVTVDGTAYPLRLRGLVIDRSDDGVRLEGKFSLVGGAALGLPESGDLVAGSFRRAEGPASSLTLELEGPPAESAG